MAGASANPIKRAKRSHQATEIEVVAGITKYTHNGLIFAVVMISTLLKDAYISSRKFHHIKVKSRRL